MPRGSAEIDAVIRTTLDAGDLNRNAQKVQRALGRITGQASEFQKSLDASTARVFAFGATTTVLAGVTSAFKAIATSTIEVEKRLIELNSILGANASDFLEFRDTVFEVAKTTGQSFNVVADAAGELARQGLGASETAKRLEAALILTRISGLDAVKSVNSLTAAINGFESAGLTAEQITNKLIAVDTNFAVSSKDLAEALARTGSAAEDAGVSFDELLGIVTAVQQTTSRGGPAIGNALKSIFTRLSRGKTIEDLQALGVAIDASQSGIQKLQALSAALTEISDPTQANAIKELAGGVYQINIVSAALKDLRSESSIAASATLKSAQATNEAYAKSEEMNKSIAAQINSLVVGMTNLAEKIGQLTFAPIFKELLQLGNGFATFLDKALDPEKGNVFIQGLFKTIGSFLSGPAIILFTTAFFKIFSLVAKYAKEGFKTVLAIGTQAEKIKSIESGIAVTLKHNVELQKQLENTTLTTAQKHDLVVKAIAAENIHLKEQQQILNGIAKAAYAKGVRGFTEAGYVGKKGKPYYGAASGFVPNFSMGEAMERQGAREHGYQAGRVKQTKIHDGNGKSFNSFVNSREKITTFTNAAGKKATIVQPPNGFGKGTQFAQGVNAAGFVPNFADMGGFAYNSALRNMARLSPAQLQAKLLAPRSTPEERMAAKFVLQKKQSGDFNARDFIRGLDAQQTPISNKPAPIAGAINLGKKDISEGPAAAFAARGITSLDQLEPFRVAGTKSFDIDGKKIPESSALRLLSSNRRASTIKAGERKKRDRERNIDHYNINADALGGILLVSPRFGLNGPRTKATLPAYKISNLYKSKTESGRDIFDKTVAENSQRDTISISGIQTTGVPEKGKDVLGISKDINELMAGPIVNLAGRMYGDLFNIGDRQQFTSKLGGFKSSVAGGILPSAAEGSIFEAASKVALASMKEMPSVFDPAGDQRPFDFSNASAMKRIFGVTSARGEAKRLGGKGYQDQIDTIANKVFNDPEYSQKALSTFLSQRMTRQSKKLENAAGGFVPNFSLFKKAQFDGLGLSGLMKGKQYSTDAGSYLKVFPNAKKKQLNIGYIKSQKKGDAYALFQHLAKIARRSKSSIYSDELTPQKAGFFKPFDDVEGDNWTKLLSVYPQLKYRDFPKSKTSGNVMSFRNEDKNFGFKSIEELKSTVNGFPKKEFEDIFESSVIHNLKTDVLGKGFIPNFSAVQGAIAREKSFGLSNSQIYVDQNASLKSSKNPLGLGVFNTRDEPNGSHQGINRARKEGKNVKSYGASGGFVPNFAPFKSDAAAPKIESFFGGKFNVAKVNEFQKSLDFLFKSFQNNNLQLRDLVITAKSIGQAVGLTGDAARKFKVELQDAAFEFSNFKGGIKTGFGKASKLPEFVPQGRGVSVPSSFGQRAIPKADFLRTSVGANKPRQDTSERKKKSEGSSFQSFFVMQTLFGALQQTTGSLSQEQNEAVEKAKSLGQSTEQLDKGFIYLDSSVTAATQALLIFSTISSLTGKSLGDFAKIGKNVITKGFPSIFKSVAGKQAAGKLSSFGPNIAKYVSPKDSGKLINSRNKGLLARGKDFLGSDIFSSKSPKLAGKASSVQKALDAANKARGKGGLLRNVKAGGLTLARSVGARGLLARGISVAGPAGLAAGAGYAGFQGGSKIADAIEERTGGYTKLGSSKYSEKLAENQMNSIIGLSQQRAASTTNFRSTAGLFQGKTKKDKEANYSSFLKDLSSTPEGNEAKKQIEELSKNLKESYKPNEQGEIDYTKVTAANDALQEAVLAAKENVDKFRAAASKEMMIDSIVKSLARFSLAIEETSQKISASTFVNDLASNVFVDPKAKNQEGIKELLSFRTQRTESLGDENSLKKLFSGRGFAEALYSGIPEKDALRAAGQVEKDGFSQELVDTYFKKGIKGLEQKLSDVGVDIKGSGKEFFDSVVTGAQEFASSAAKSYQSLLNSQSEIKSSRDSLKSDFDKFVKDFSAELVTALTNLVSRVGEKLKSFSEIGKVDIEALTKGYQDIGAIESKGGKDAARQAAERWLQIADEEAKAVSAYGDKIVAAWKANAGISTGFQANVVNAQPLSQGQTGSFGLRERITGSKYLPNDLRTIKDKGISSEEDVSRVTSDLRRLKGSQGGRFDKEIEKKIKDLEALKNIDSTDYKKTQEEANKKISEESKKVGEEMEKLWNRMLGVNTAMTSLSDQFKDMPNLKASIKDLDDSIKAAAGDGKKFQEFSSKLGELSTSVGGTIEKLRLRVEEVAASIPPK